jgi:superfamily II DNA/RNA helicase
MDMLELFDSKHSSCSDDEENQVFNKIKINGKKFGKSGGFQAMGLSYPVIKGILKRGYKVPTPIQRKVNSVKEINLISSLIY